MANKTFNSDKVVQKKTCSKCGQTMKNVRIAGQGKTKMARECNCGLFVGNEKI